MNKNIIIELEKAQKVLLDQQYPGYPYQDSIILDFSSDSAISHYGDKDTIENALNKLYADLLYQVIGHTKSNKPSFLYDRNIASVNEFTNPLFDNDNLYIDNALAARFYLAIQSALCEIHDKKLQNVVVWGCIDNESEYIDVKIFDNYRQVKKYVKTNFLDFE